MVSYDRRFMRFLNALEFLFYYSINIWLEEITHILFSVSNSQMVVDIFLSYPVHIIDKFFVRYHKVR